MRKQKSEKEKKIHRLVFKKLLFAIPTLKSTPTRAPKSRISSVGESRDRASHLEAELPW